MKPIVITLTAAAVLLASVAVSYFTTVESAKPPIPLPLNAVVIAFPFDQDGNMLDSNVTVYNGTFFMTLANGTSYEFTPGDVISK
jgi:hypothetical protein